MNSMTGYGRAQGSFEGRDITVEIRAVNHRYFDCTVKAGRLYGYLEDPVKKAAQSPAASSTSSSPSTIPAPTTSPSKQTSTFLRRI